MLKRINESKIRKIIKQKLLENYKKRILKETDTPLQYAVDQNDDAIKKFFAEIKKNPKDVCKKIGWTVAIQDKEDLLRKAGFSGFSGNDTYGLRGNPFEKQANNKGDIIYVEKDYTQNKEALNTPGWKIIGESISGDKIGLYVYYNGKDFTYFLIRKWDDDTSETVRDMLEDIIDENEDFSDNRGYFNDSEIVDYLTDDGVGSVGDVMENTEFMIFKREGKSFSYIFARDYFIDEVLTKLGDITSEKRIASQSNVAIATMGGGSQQTRSSSTSEESTSSEPPEDDQAPPEDDQAPPEDDQAPPEDDQAPPEEDNEGSVLFRIPQLNGGYFELAKILLDEDRMNELQDITTGGYKPKEIEKNLIRRFRQYGPTDSSKIQNIVAALTDTNGPIKGFASTANVDPQDIVNRLSNSRDLGKYLADFYMHQMFKVSQFIIISSGLFSYLYYRAIDDIQNAKKVVELCKNTGLNKVLKSDINVNTALSQIQSTAGELNISLEKMFQGRAAKAMSGKDKQSQMNKTNLDTATKNERLAKGSAALAKANPMR
jgi:hypothetical protein